MGNTTSRTFGPPMRVSCGKFRIIGIRRFCLLCLMVGLFTVGRLSAQEPGGGPPGGDEGRGGRDRGGGRGGRGGFDPAQMIAGLDKDGNGVITASEIEQMPGPFRDRLQQSGMDFNKGVRVDEMQQNMQRQMEERRQGGGGDQGGRGGEDRGRDRGRDFERSDRPEIPPPQDMGPGNGRDGRGDNRGNTSPGGSPTPAPTPGTGGNSSTSKKGRTRISPLLPDAYKDLDSDYDGQIALYEWRKGKRGTISQFVQNDFDGDGFLIAKELAKAVATTTPVTPAAPGAGPATVTATATPMAPAAPVAVSADAAAKALRAFELLDNDKSGTVLGPEWDKSTRLKPMFEKGGVNLAQPLTQVAFTQAFVRVGADK